MINYSQIEYRRQRQIVRSMKSLVAMLPSENNKSELRRVIFSAWKERMAARTTVQFHASKKVA